MVVNPNEHQLSRNTWLGRFNVKSGILPSTALPSMEPHQASPASTAPASTRVLELYELAENVLLFLPLQDLLLANRVCKTWHNVITRSDRINKVLFKQPVDDRRISYPHETFKITPGMAQPSWRTKDTPDAGVAHPVINPFIAEKISSEKYEGSSICRFLNRVCRSDSIEEGGSWGDLLLTQPPAKKLFFQCRLSRIWSPNRILGTFSAESIWPTDSSRGVRLVEIAESVKAHMAKCPECPTELVEMHTCFHGVRWTKAMDPKVTSGWEMLAWLENDTE